jgi:NAD-dependent epimerase/dehydratase family protein
MTGGAGFVGSAMVCRAPDAGYQVLTIDKLTYAGRRETLAEVMASPRHHFLQADVADCDAMEAAISDFDPDAVLHLAPESHDRSIDVRIRFWIQTCGVPSFCWRRPCAAGRGCPAPVGPASASCTSRPTRCSEPSSSTVALT